MAELHYRRVVTGLDDRGESCILVDEPLRGPLDRVSLVWTTDDVPADNSSREDFTRVDYSFDLMHSGGTLFAVHEFPPHQSGDAFWHATDTIDYVTVVEGEVTLMTQAGGVTLERGTVLVDRGIYHAWRNDGDAAAVVSIVVVPAEPVGEGRTV